MFRKTFMDTTQISAMNDIICSIQDDSLAFGVLTLDPCALMTSPIAYQQALVPSILRGR